MTERRDVRGALEALAYRQAGYFTAAQAVEVGYSHQAQKYHVDHGTWLRVERGIYRLRGWPAAIDDVLVLWTLWSRGRGVVSHATALAVHGLGVLDPGVVTLTMPPGSRAKHDAVRIVLADLSSSDVEEREAFRVTTPLRTLLDAAGTESQESVDEVVGEALERGLVTARQLRARADEHGDRAALRIERALAAASK